jgi:large subunit ribosomal protein L24
MAARIKKGDLVKAIAGDDAGKTGKILQLLPDSDRALVEGLNFVKKHMRKTQDNPQGGVFEKEAPIHLSNLKKAES